MARKKRILSESGRYHIILRGNNQQNLFYDDQDRYFLLNRLKKYSSELKIDIFAYCLMDNHIHILLGNAIKTLSLFVQKLANSYVYYFNRKYERSGHLFQGRFKSEAVDDEIYFKTVLRYILQNPVKVRKYHFENFKWSNYKDFIKYNYSNSDESNALNFVCSLFDSKNQLINFLLEKNCDSCMEYENHFFISDIKAIQIINQIFKKHPAQLLKLDMIDAGPKIKKLKEKGLSISQISRLTGINRKILKTA